MSVAGRPPSRAHAQPQPLPLLNTSPRIIRLAVMRCDWFPLLLRNVEGLMHWREIEISHEIVRFWRNRFGPIFAAEIWCRRLHRIRVRRHPRWHLDEVNLKINGLPHDL